jgi:hypothetical protein
MKKLILPEGITTVLRKPHETEGHKRGPETDYRNEDLR